jgi:putative intracellular protease/amidase
MEQQKTPTRRQIGEGLAALATTLAATTPAAIAAETPRPPEPAHDMNEMPAHWMGKEEIAFLIYPGFTALDMVGPHYMLTMLMGAKVHLVAESREAVVSDTGLTFIPSATFEDCPVDLDILCVPGGTTGTLQAIRNERTLAFVKDRGSRAKLVTSVCTGSLVLAAAGLLKGYRATSHWIARPLLAKAGATPVDARIVTDRNRITGAGVTAGLDFGLTLVAQLRDRPYAEAVQLLAEYAPEPPFDAGTVEKAPAAKVMLDGMFANFSAEAGRTLDRALNRRG